jgi:acetyl-CoA carboxylase biotin carboxylase subunit
MILVAGGEPLRYQQSDVRVSGHAIEVRINAEDGARDFRPSPGTVTALQVPGGMGTRFDTLLYAGYTVSPFYDSLLGKLIVWDISREMALCRLGRALSELKVDGIITTTPLHQHLVETPEIRAGTFHTRWLEQWLMTNVKPQDAMMEQSSR